MKLDQFVTQTLISIISGIKNANEEAFKNKLSEHSNGTFVMMNYSDKISDGQYIHFDVAVIASSQVSGDVKGHGDILVASVDANVEAKHNHENFSRVKFKILNRA